MNIIKRGEANFIHWFQRHLNLTWVLGCLLAFVVALMMPVVIEGTLFAPVTVGSTIVAGIIILGVSSWVIIQKGRSLWWILLSGLFSPLWLKNKTTA